MSRIFEALQHANPELMPTPGIAEAPEGVSNFVSALTGGSTSLEEASRFDIPQCPPVRLVAWTHPNSLGAEKLRGLAARYKRAQESHPMRKLLVTSAVQGDGKSTISLNLAVTFAIQGERTLLVDGDFHQPSLSGSLGVSGDSGFANWCKEQRSDRSFLRRANGLPLWFLPGGKCEGQPLTLLQSSEAADLIKQLSGWFTRIVIDSPPLIPLADSSAWVSLSDSIILVARDGVTPRKPLAKSMEYIDKSKLFAIVMNNSNVLEEKYYNSYYNDKHGR